MTITLRKRFETVWLLGFGIGFVGGLAFGMLAMYVILNAK
jgi:hypothetical protein